jgi:hypothetical protein
MMPCSRQKVSACTAERVRVHASAAYTRACRLRPLGTFCLAAAAAAHLLIFGIHLCPEVARLLLKPFALAGLPLSLTALLRHLQDSTESVASDVLAAAVALQCIMPLQVNSVTGPTAVDCEAVCHAMHPAS